MMDRTTLLELIPAYALDALDEGERQEIEAFLKRDPEARNLLADYEAVTAMLPLAAPLRPAPAHLQNDLRQRLAARQTNTAPKPPISVVPPASQKVETAKEPVKPALNFPIGLIAAAAVIIVAVIGGVIFFLNSQAPSEISIAQALYDEIVAQGDFARYDVTPAESLDIDGDLVVSADGSQAVLRIASLPNRGTDESYQLWLNTLEESQSGGIFYWPDGHGPYYVTITMPIDELVRIGMSIEPNGGSPLGNQPSNPFLFGVEIAAAN